MLAVAACHDSRPPNVAQKLSGGDRAIASSDVPTPAALGSTPPTCAVDGGITRITVQSAVVATSIRVSIVSPKSTAASIGIVYLLHGAGTDETQWEAVGVEAALDDLVATGDTRPFTVVLPDLPMSYDANLDGSALLNDVAPAVERCLGGAPNRQAIGGISRGGELALLVAADHGGTFVAVGGHSPAVADVDQMSLVQRLASTNVRVWLDVGLQDPLRPATQQLATGLTDAGTPPELHMSAGGHDRVYWGAHVREYLRWYAAALSS
jgi:enterochelin esterase-like enzyme